MADLDLAALLHDTMPFCDKVGMYAVGYSDDAVSVGLAWTPELCTSGGAIHGGALMALADSAGAICAFRMLPDGAVGTTTIESKTNFIRGVTKGNVVATASILHRGGSTIVVETSIRDDDGRLVAKVTQTQAVLRPR